MKKLTIKQRKKLCSRRPTNFAYWRFTLINPKEVEAFLTRGNKRQHMCMVRVLNYVSRFDKEYFEKVNGESILRRLKANEE